MSGLCCAKREKKKNLQYVNRVLTLLTRQKKERKKKNDGQFAFLA